MKDFTVEPHWLGIVVLYIPPFDSGRTDIGRSGILQNRVNFHGSYHLYLGVHGRRRLTTLYQSLVRLGAHGMSRGSGRRTVEKGRVRYQDQYHDLLTSLRRSEKNEKGTMEGSQVKRRMKSRH